MSYTAEQRTVPVRSLINKKAPNNRSFSSAAGRTRTGTAVNRLILSQVRLPIPPQRHEKRFAKTDLYNIISADKKQAFYFGMEK